jgi:8-oxo-dGTP diphosphatase
MSKEDKLPSITVDAVVFTYKDDKLHVLLIKRNYKPFKDAYALPGAFIKEQMSAENSVFQMLEDETGLKIDYIEQLKTYSHPNRDPRQRIISIAYFALINSGNYTSKTTSHATEVEWVEIKEAVKRELAFDHKKIIFDGWARLRVKLRWMPIGFDLLPAFFTIGELHNLYCAILDEDIDRRNFTRKLLKSGLLIETPFKSNGHVGRKAKMYEFDKETYKRLEKHGYNFEL